MLRIVNLEEIQGLLLLVPALVDRLEKHDPDFVDQVKSWLVEGERVLGNNRLPAAGSLAALRATLVNAQSGVIPPGYQTQKRLSRRKMGEMIASDVLRQGSELLSQVIAADGKRVDEAAQLTRQLVALAVYKELIPDPRKVSDPTGYLRAVWKAMEADSDLQTGTVRLLGLVGQNDALLLLDRTITADIEQVLH